MRKCFPAWGVGVFTVQEQPCKWHNCRRFLRVLADFASGQSHPWNRNHGFNHASLICTTNDMIVLIFVRWHKYCICMLIISLVMGMMHWIRTAHTLQFYCGTHVVNWLRICSHQLSLWTLLFKCHGPLMTSHSKETAICDYSANTDMGFIWAPAFGVAAFD